MNLPSRYVATGLEFTSGGMSSAIVCTDTHLDRLVLVKFLHNGVDQKRLLDEVAALSAIRSKHVVQVYDLLRDDNGDVTAIVEEYLPGQDLNENLPVTTAEELLKTAYAISCGICDVHDAGRVHRDIKPNNMKYDAEGCLKIFDFGLSRSDDIDAKTKGFLGTLGYAAPELFVADGVEVEFTQAVDVFAFASTVLKLMRGKLPNGLRGVPPVLPCGEADFAAQSVSLPPEIASLLNECHSPDPAKRPPIRRICERVGAHLTRNQHRATLVLGNQVYQLDAGNKLVNISAGTLGAASIRYDGLKFEIMATAGDVSVNNMPIAGTVVLPGSCVIILGNPALGSQRRYVTVDVSHPEVVL